MVHIWNGIGSLGTDMEVVWCLISPNFKVWELCGKKGWKTYGYAVPAHFSHQVCLTFFMELM